MPDIDGFAVAAHLRQMGDFPIIFLSALSEVEYSAFSTTIGGRVLSPGYLFGPTRGILYPQGRRGVIVGPRPAARAEGRANARQSRCQQRLCRATESAINKIFADS